MKKNDDIKSNQRYSSSEEESSNEDNIQSESNNRAQQKNGTTTSITDFKALQHIIKNVNLKKSKVINEEDLVIYVMTFNMKGKKPSKEDMKILLPKENLIDKVKYNMYVIGSQESMRSIFMAFFNDEQDEWVNMIK